MAKEINLVPDIKAEMIKTLKLRNLIFFVCIAASVVAVAVVIILGSIMGGQQLVMENRKNTINELSNKLNADTELGKYLTIQSQLDQLSEIELNKNAFPRTFSILAAMMPMGADKITVSELNVNLTEQHPTWTMEAQANAGAEPFIDYNVLDSFKKSMPYLKYDTGRYVDKDGEKIPAYCMIETAEDGSLLSDSEKGIYAFWDIDAKGCLGSAKRNDYTTESYGDREVVRIWRTPQYTDWYETKLMTEDGAISGVAHFDSDCIHYSRQVEGGKVKWNEDNQECLMIHRESDEDEGIIITESSNGRDSSGELVLRFAATITLNPEVYDFNNKHVVMLPPSGRYNVTDSYVQIQSIFSEKAEDCKADDATCKNTNGEKK